MPVEQNATPEVVNESATAPNNTAPIEVSAPASSQVAPQEAPQSSPSGTAAEPASTTPEPAPEREPTLLEAFDAAEAAKETKAEGAEGQATPGDAGKPDGKPEEQPKTEEPKAAEPEQAKAEEKPAEKPEPFKFEELQIPDGFAKRFDLPEAEVAARIGEFNDILLKDVNPNERRSALLNLHTKAMQEFADKFAKNQQNAWNEYNKSQALATMSDEELGGAGHQTAMGAVARVRDALTSDYSKTEKQELNDFLVVTGAGSHRAFLRLVHRMARYLDEPQAPTFSPQPPPDRGQKPGRKSSVLYDNARSP